MRLVADIEKLIKNKLEVETFPLEQDRSNGQFGEGRRDERRPERREERRDDRRPERGFERRREEEGDRRSSFRPAQVSRDPFFEKPYEAQEPSVAESGTASWEASPKTGGSRPGMSANIKPKRKVAALFKSGE
jgi:hypothetical protein